MRNPQNGNGGPLFGVLPLSFLLASVALLLLAHPIRGEKQWPARVADINTTVRAGGSSPGEFVRLGDYVYFTAEDGASGRELWRTDGTAATGREEKPDPTVGTALFKDIRLGPDGSDVNSLTVSGDTLFFVSSDRISGGVIGGEQKSGSARRGSHAGFDLEELTALQSRFLEHFDYDVLEGR